MNSNYTICKAKQLPNSGSPKSIMLSMMIVIKRGCCRPFLTVETLKFNVLYVLPSLWKWCSTVSFLFFSPGAWYANRCHNRTRMWVLYSPPLAPTLFWSNASHVLRIRVRSFSSFFKFRVPFVIYRGKTKKTNNIGVTQANRLIR